MTLRVQSVSFDSHDPRATAAFWEGALGWRRTYDTEDEVVLEPPLGSREDGVAADILFLRVPEEKAVKNRLHLDPALTTNGVKSNASSRWEPNTSTSGRTRPPGGSYSRIPKATSSAFFAHMRRRS
jgi:hypothetical protein